MIRVGVYSPAITLGRTMTGAIAINLKFDTLTFQLLGVNNETS
jgi:hypothetical protein